MLYRAPSPTPPAKWDLESRCWRSAKKQAHNIRPLPLRSILFSLSLSLSFPLPLSPSDRWIALCLSSCVSSLPSQLLVFFDNMGEADKRVTLEEMILGFRKIRREWAYVKAESAGRAVLAKVVRLMGRAGMSLEDWFSFMDSSQVRARHQISYNIFDETIHVSVQEKCFVVLSLATIGGC